MTSLAHKLDGVVRYLAPRLEWANCHMVNYLSDNLWERFVPLELRKEIGCAEDVEMAIDVIWGRSDSDKFEHLRKFLDESKAFSLTSLKVLTSLEEFSQRLGVVNNFKDCLSVKEFMSEKKCHEVEMSAAVVAALAKRDRLVVVDAGDGKGYLSSRVALQHKLNVIGIDSNPSNSEGAIKRITRLEKAWNGLTRRAEDIKNGQTPERLGKTLKKHGQYQKKESSNYQTLTQFITPDIDLMAISNIYPDNNGICLTGLHTCGNLATTCLKLFNNRSEVKTVFNVGCCYHFLEERFEHPCMFLKKKYENPNATAGDFGFPLSAQLIERQFTLGRNARMLSCQSVERTSATQEIPYTPLFYRALFEVLMKEKRPDIETSVQVGRIKKYNSFPDYVQKCLQKANISMVFDEHELDEFCGRYRQEEQLLRLFYLLRMSLAPVIEGLILLDRVVFLMESAATFRDVFLVQLFDPVVSPRCYSVIGVK